MSSNPVKSITQSESVDVCEMCGREAFSARHFTNKAVAEEPLESGEFVRTGRGTVCLKWEDDECWLVLHEHGAEHIESTKIESMD